ncbi:MAG: hypothetical protein CL607_10580 [Anaerolineaceae bacterium]|nr:hypothetical protein [Anaerolineaceae bacterium]
MSKKKKRDEHGLSWRMTDIVIITLLVILVLLYTVVFWNQRNRTEIYPESTQLAPIMNPTLEAFQTETANTQIAVTIAQNTPEATP